MFLTQGGQQRRGALGPTLLWRDHLPQSELPRRPVGADRARQECARGGEEFSAPAFAQLGMGQVRKPEEAGGNHRAPTQRSTTM
jgi:hypothetical protein